jgi:hypothetical protein
VETHSTASLGNELVEEKGPPGLDRASLDPALGCIPLPYSEPQDLIRGDVQPDRAQEIRQDLAVRSAAPYRHFFFSSMNLRIDASMKARNV